jgi:nitroreductase
MSATPKLDAWSVSPHEFPLDGGADQKLMFMLNFAILAPSSHNTQPWLFRLQGHEVDLIADLRRALPVVDPQNRELIMSCGAALHHLRLAARYFGYHTCVECFPEENYPDLLARVSLGEPCETRTDDILAFHAIDLRRTNRMPFSSEPVSNDLLNVLEQLAERENAWLHFVRGDQERFTMAHLVSRADREQWHDRRFRSELSDWLTPNNSARRDGIPGYAQGLGDLVSHAEPLIVRTFDLGKGQAARDREIALHSPVLAVLGTPGDTRLDWLNAGQALSAILLRARTDEVWASFLNQPVECEDTRAELAELTGRSGSPQIVLRMGYGQDVKPTPRRPLIQTLLQPKNRPIRIHVG